jgi:uncharacterized protein DUF6335
MAKRKAARRAKPTKTVRKAAKRPVTRKASAKKKTAAKKVKKKAVSRPKPRAKARSKSSTAASGKVPRLDRARRTLNDGETMQTPPSSLNMDRRGSAARSGRAGMAQSQREHQGMSADLQAGDVDVDLEDAYFTGEEAPGGDNPTPDQDIVDDIGKALGVTYDDNEELKGSDKVVERDKHRWELDPASAEDFRERDKK